MHDLDTIIKRNAMPASYTHAPTKGETVIIRNVYSNGINEHPAIVTRKFTEKLINVMVMPDGGHPFPQIDVEFFQTKKEAIAHLATLLPGEKEEKRVAYWPTHTSMEGMN
jgi:hypothetical protein